MKKNTQFLMALIVTVNIATLLCTNSKPEKLNPGHINEHLISTTLSQCIQKTMQDHIIQLQEKKESLEKTSSPLFSYLKGGFLAILGIPGIIQHGLCLYCLDGDTCTKGYIDHWNTVIQCARDPQSHYYRTANIGIYFATISPPTLLWSYTFFKKAWNHRMHTANAIKELEEKIAHNQELITLLAA